MSPRRTHQVRKKVPPLGGAALSLVLLLGAGWFFLHSWRPMALPGVQDVRELGKGPVLPGKVFPLLEGKESSPSRRSLLGPDGGGGRLAGRVRVLDALTRRPLEGASLFSLGRPPSLLGRTDGEGLAPLPPGLPLERLLVRKAGYLGMFLGLSSPFFRELRARAGKGDLVLGLPPDPVTRPLHGKVTRRGGQGGMAGVEVTLLALEPSDPAAPPRPVPPALAGSWRLALAVESLCRGAPLRGPWELGTWGPRVATRSGRDGRFQFRVISRGRGVLSASDASGNTARRVVDLEREGPWDLPLSPGSWLFFPGERGGGRVEVLCSDGWRLQGRAGGKLGPFLPGEILDLRFFRAGTRAGIARVTAPPAGETLNLSFPPPADLVPWRARVLERGSGRPVEGARVRLLGGGEARTGRDGRFTLLLPEEGFRLVTVGGEGIQERRLSLDPGKPLPLEVEVLPSSGGKQLGSGALTLLEGMVRDPSGRPVASARVEAFDLEGPAPGELRARGRLRSSSDRIGRFELLLPAPGRYRLRAFHPRVGAASRVVRPVPGEKVSLDLILSPPLEVRGRVVSRDSGLPVEGARVLLSREGWPSCQGRTDREGRFLLKPWLPGSWTLQVFGPQGEKACRKLDLPPGGREDLQVVLGR